MPAIEETKEEKEERENKGLRHMLVIGLHNIKPMFKKPLGPYLALFGAMNFLIMLLYNVIRLWFPQLSTIVEYYNQIESNQDLCVMLDAYTSDLRMRTANSTAFEVCVPRKSGTATYVNSMILGSVCLLPYLFSGVLVNKIGKKYLEMISGVIAVACTLSLRWASSKTAVVALFSIDLAVAQTMMSLLQAMTIEVFPTTTRTLAISMTMTTGRIGTLCGNIAFPILLDMGCVIPFFTLTGVMICVTVMTTIMPKKKKK